MENRKSCKQIVSHAAQKEQVPEATAISEPVLLKISEENEAHLQQYNKN